MNIDYLCNREALPREERGEDGIKLWYTENFWAPRRYELEERLLDLDESRIKTMDAVGIDMQVTRDQLSRKITCAKHEKPDIRTFSLPPDIPSFDPLRASDSVVMSFRGDSRGILIL